MSQYINIDSPTIELCFTRSNTFGSRLIRGVLEEPVSHVCFMVENAVIHSNFFGVHVDLKKRFLDNNEVVYKIPVNFEFPELQERLQLLLQSYTNYDYRGFAYFSWRALLRKLFDAPLPSVNKLNTKRAYLCTEFATMVLSNEEHGILTPYALYLQLIAQGAKNGGILH